MKKDTLSDTTLNKYKKQTQYNTYQQKKQKKRYNMPLYTGLRTPHVQRHGAQIAKGFDGFRVHYQQQLYCVQTGFRSTQRMMERKEAVFIRNAQCSRKPVDEFFDDFYPGYVLVENSDMKWKHSLLVDELALREGGIGMRSEEIDTRRIKRHGVR